MRWWGEELRSFYRDLIPAFRKLFQLTHLILHHNGPNCNNNFLTGYKTSNNLMCFMIKGFISFRHIWFQYSQLTSYFTPRTRLEIRCGRGNMFYSFLTRVECIISSFHPSSVKIADALSNQCAFLMILSSVESVA